MTRILILTIFSVFIACSSLAQGALSTKGKRFVGFPDDAKAFGLFAGEPMAVRGYLFTSWKRAFAFSLGYSFSKVAQGSVDYLFYGYSARDKLIDKNFWNSLIFYAGAGVLGGAGLAGSDSNNKFQVGARIVGGTEYILSDTNWTFRLELAPQFFFKGAESFGVSAGIGATYYLTEGKTISRRKNMKSSTPSESEFEEFE